MNQVRAKFLSGLTASLVFSCVCHAAAQNELSSTQKPRLACLKVLAAMAVSYSLSGSYFNSLASEGQSLSYKPPQPMPAQQLNETRGSALDLQNISMQALNGSYSKTNIAKTAELAFQFPLRLIVFDGQQFHVYSLNHERLDLKREECPRCLRSVALVIGAMQSQFPERFAPGSEPFEVLFSDADITKLYCMKPGEPKQCKDRNLAPIVAFGSGFKDERIAPNIRIYPNDRYTVCLVDWLDQDSKPGRYCWEKDLEQVSTHDFAELRPQIVWRGGDNNLGGLDEFGLLRKIDYFLAHKNLTQKEAANTLLSHWDELRFRLRAVALSLKAEAEKEAETEGKDSLPWIDAKFVFSSRSKAPEEWQEMGLAYALADKYMDTREMSEAKYQLDLGGASGTSWRGFIFKLAMPGLVFHQECPSQDWFFTEIKPWVHYVPVKIGLSDLAEKFAWAEQNPKEARKIADAGRRFVKAMTQEDFLQMVYFRYFKDELEKIIGSYEPAGDLPEIIAYYESRGFTPLNVGVCNASSCSVITKAHRPAEQISIPSYRPKENA